MTTRFRGPRPRLLATSAAVAMAAAAAGAFADGSTSVPVTTVVATGTRTLTVTDPTGAAIGSSGLPLGAGHGGALLVNVSDVRYAHVGYQVTATMTNLYPYAGGTFDFGAQPIPSKDVHVGYPGRLVDLVDVKSLVQPVVKLTGTLNLGPLGSAVNVSQTVDGAAVSVQNVLDAVTRDTLSGLLDKLPISLQTGDAGSFTSPAALPGEPAAHPDPTSLTVMTGDAQQPLTSVLLGALNDTYGGKTAQELVDSGLLDRNAVVAAAAAAIGVTPDLLRASDITQILTTLTGTVDSITGSVLGQTGSYSSLPALSIDVPSDVASGLYRGQLTVTLMDK